MTDHAGEFEHPEERHHRCEHGFVKPCTVCDPHVAAKAMAKGLPVSTPGAAMTDHTGETVLLCGAWGYWPSADPDTVKLRKAGVHVAGPCKRVAFHDGSHSLDQAAPTGSSEAQP